MAKKNKALDFLTDELGGLGNGLLPDKQAVKKDVKEEVSPTEEIAKNVKAKDSETQTSLKEEATSSEADALTSRNVVKEITPVRESELAKIEDTPGRVVDEISTGEETSVNVRHSLENQYINATEFFRDGNNPLNLNLDDLTTQRLNWAEQAIGFKDSRKSKRLVIAAMAEVFFQQHGKEIQTIIERKSKDELKRMKSKF